MTHDIETVSPAAWTLAGAVVAALLAAPGALRAQDPEPPGVASASSDWPGFGGPVGNATSPETGLLTTFPEVLLNLVFERSA